MLSFDLPPGKRLLFALRAALILLAGVNFACDGHSNVSPNEPAPPSTTRSYAYITNGSDNTVTSYKLDPATGAITGTGYTSVGKFPVAVVTLHTANGNFLYVANKDDNTVSQFSISPSGTLSALSPPTVKTGKSPVALLPTRSNEFVYDRVYVANQADSTISIFHVNTDGTLGIVGTSAANGTGPIKLAISVSGLRVLNVGSNTLSTFDVLSDAAGGLKANTTDALVSGVFPTDMTYFDSFFITESKNNRVLPYGDELALRLGHVVTVPNTPVSITFCPNPANGTAYGVFVGSSAGAIYQYRYDPVVSNTALSPQQAPPITFPAQQVVVKATTSGTLYALLNASSTVQGYTIDGITLNPASVKTARTGTNPTDIAFADISISTGDVQTTVK